MGRPERARRPVAALAGCTPGGGAGALLGVALMATGVAALVEAGALSASYSYLSELGARGAKHADSFRL
ncbi:MAG: hypothetical protein GEV08_13245, partial [Acidimicrobiia bacterium]|nr:hypothetical protein [Acidimicrobiia bacterium]